MINIQINGRQIQVSGHGNMEDHIQYALNSRIFKEWRDGLDVRFQVSSVTVRAVDFRGKPSPESVMFVRLRVKAANTPFEQVVELRGGTVILLPVIHCDGEDYTILVSQPRIATGIYDLVEVPAGMIDGGSFGGAAAREIKEELGLEFKESELLEISPQGGVYLSPGLLDERAKVFCAERTMERSELDALNDAATGLKEEGEMITLKVIRLAELAETTRDGKALIALALYNNKKQN